MNLTLTFTRSIIQCRPICESGQCKATHLQKVQWELLMFLKSYADESYDERVYCCGSFFGFPRDFFYLGLKWEERLKKDNLDYFRASDCENLNNQFSPDSPPGFGSAKAGARANSIHHDLLEIIQSDVIGGISVGIVRNDFTKLIADNPKARRHFGEEIMTCCYKKLIKASADLMERDWPETPDLKIAFLLDEHGNWKQAEAAYGQLKETDPACAKRMLVVRHEDDKEYPGLQMADLMAYESRLRTIAWLAGSAGERQGFKALTKNNNIYFIGVMDRETMLRELSELPDH